MAGWLEDVILRPFKQYLVISGRWDGGIMKNVCNETPFTVEKISALGGARTQDPG